MRQHRGQFRLLKGKHTANAQHKLVELKKSIRLVFVASKTMKNATRQLAFVLFKDVYHLVLPLSAVYHQGQIIFNRPTHLFFEGFKLLLLKFSTPIEIKSNLTNGDERM